MTCPTPAPAPAPAPAPRPQELIEWQPVYHQRGAVGKDGGLWSARWQDTLSSKIAHLLARWAWGGAGVGAAMSCGEFIPGPEWGMSWIFHSRPPHHRCFGFLADGTSIQGRLGVGGGPRRT